MADIPATASLATTKPEVKTAPPTMPAFTKDQEAYIQQLVIQTALTVQQSLGAQVAANAKPRANHVAREECIICKQVRAACKDDHTEMIVYPTKYPEFGTYFTGVKINGIVYYSYNESYSIKVPTACVSMITNAINAFEQNERTIGKKRTVEHNSGSIGPHGKGFNKASAAWR